MLCLHLIFHQFKLWFIFTNLPTAVWNDWYHLEWKGKKQENSKTSYLKLLSEAYSFFRFFCGLQKVYEYDLKLEKKIKVFKQFTFNYSC